MSATLAALLILLAAARAAPAPADLPVIDVRPGVALAALPGAAVLLPPRGETRDGLALTLTAARVRVFTNASAAEPTLEFIAPAYVSDVDGQAHLFGAGARLAAGGALRISLTNNLTYDSEAAYEAAAAVANGKPDYRLFHDPAGTNMHTHGVHASPGAGPQAGMAEAYRGGDNMFYRVPPRLPGEAAATVDYHYSIAANHLPGIYWVRAAAFLFFFNAPRCTQSPVVVLTRRRPRSLSLSQYHPHKHGATFLQSGTAHGLIVVEDDARWLPADGGCAPLAAALAAAPEAALDFEVLPFAGAGAAVSSAAPLVGQSKQKTS
jgi:FtsP/CotA-like multicopper oxidase with cupredoxin domain